MRLNIAFFLYLVATYAQDLASLTINVSDPSGALIPAASVTLTETQRAKVYSGETKAGGGAAFERLVPGSYSVRVLKAGFKIYQQNGLVLSVRDRLTLSVRLDLEDAASSSVTVSAAQNADPAIGIALEQDYLQNLPVNGRNAESLILMTPGITSAGVGPGGDGFNANGLRSNTNYYTLDGVSVNRPVGGGGPGPGGPGGPGGGGPPGGAPSSSTTLISIDAMQEMRVQTSSFAPEFGRTPGAQIVMTSRGGTNSFHGSLFDYIRRDQLNANDWFANSLGFHRGEERQNRPGGTLGGRLIRDRLFFFASVEDLRLVAPSSISATVPDAAARASASSALKPFLNAFPIANGESLSNNAALFRALVSNPSKSDTGSFRVDGAINDRSSAFLRYSFTPGSGTQRGSEAVSPNVVSVRDSKSHSGTAAYTRALSHGGVNDLRVNFSKFASDSHSWMDSFGGAIPLNDAQVFPKGVTSLTGTFSLNVMGISGYSFAAHNQSEQQQINVVDSITRPVDRHQLKAGLDVRDTLTTTYRKPYSESVSFNGVSGYDNSLLKGVALNGQVASNVTEVYPTYLNVSAYGQDTWQVTQWTTITYGLRWDINPAPTNRNGQAPFALSSNSIAGVTQNEPLYKTRYFDVAPRFGIAYNMDERAGREMMLRAGIGLFYDTGYGTTGSAFSGAPYSNVRTLSSITFPFTVANQAAPGLPATRPYGQVSTAETDLKSPIVTQMSLSWERNYGTGQTLNISYAQTNGRRLSRIETQPAFSSAYNVLMLATNGASSDYRGLLVSFRKRMSRRMQMQLSYTWSHSIDSASNDAGFGGGGGLASLFGGGERGSSDYDIRHNLNLSGSYQLPSPKGWAYAPVRHWFLDFIVTARTGLPFGITGVSSSTSTTSTSSTTGSVSGLFAQVRPDYNGQSVWVDDPTAPGGKRVNKDAFEVPDGYAQGNLGRNALRGFGAAQMDLSIRRMIPLGERVRLNLAAQAYNALNHPNFANPSPFEGGNLSSPQFGLAKQMVNQAGGGGVNAAYQSGGARTMELSIRLQF